MTTTKATRAQAAAGCVAALVLLATPQPGRTSALVEALGLPTLQSLTATVERPLFMRSRRPPAEAPEVEEEEKPVAVAKEEAPGELTGIVIGPERTYALLTRRENQETELLRQGQTIDQWNVEEIGPRHVVLRRGAGQIRLELFDEKEQKSSGRRRPADGRTNFRGRPSQANQRRASTKQTQRRPQPRRPARSRSGDDDD